MLGAINAIHREIRSGQRLSTMAAEHDDLSLSLISNHKKYLRSEYHAAGNAGALLVDVMPTDPNAARMLSAINAGERCA